MCLGFTKNKPSIRIKAGVKIRPQVRVQCRQLSFVITAILYLFVFVKFRYLKEDIATQSRNHGKKFTNIINRWMTGKVSPKYHRSFNKYLPSSCSTLITLSKLDVVLDLGKLSLGWETHPEVELGMPQVNPPQVKSEPGSEKMEDVRGTVLPEAQREAVPQKEQQGERHEERDIWGLQVASL